MKQSEREVVAILVRSFVAAGAEKQAALLANVLSEDFRVLCLELHDGGEDNRCANFDSIRDKVMPVGGMTFLTKIIRLYRLLKQHNVSVLFCYQPSSNIAGAIAGRMAGVKRIYGGIRGSSLKKNRLKMMLQRFLFNRICTKVVSNSYRAKEAYVRYGVSSDKIHVIHNAIITDREYYQREPVHTIRILSAGRMIAEKDHLTALKAIKKIKDSADCNTPFTYTIVGGGWDAVGGKDAKHLRAFIKENGLEDHVTLVHHVNDMDSYYRQSDIFLITSANEGMPNVVMEAMSWSLPVVATDAGDLSFLVKNEQNGYVCPVGGSSEIAGSLIMLLESHEKRVLFGKKSHDHISGNFNEQILLHRYRELLAKHGTN